jgi:hypothetical protein
MTQHHDGGCLCGDVRYRVTAQPVIQCYCCCATCRGASGAAAVPWIAVPETGYTITKGEPVTFQSSDTVIRQFCGRCGTALNYRNTDYPDNRFQADALVAVASATLDDIEAFPPNEVFHGDELPSWIKPEDLCPGAKHHHGKADEQTT